MILLLTPPRQGYYGNPHHCGLSVLFLTNQSVWYYFQHLINNKFCSLKWTDQVPIQEPTSTKTYAHSSEIVSGKIYNARPLSWEIGMKLVMVVLQPQPDFVETFVLLMCGPTCIQLLNSEVTKMPVNKLTFHHFTNSGQTC